MSDRIADQFPAGWYRAGFRPGGGAHSLDDFENDLGIGAGARQISDLDPLAWPCRTDQHPAGLNAHRVVGADGEARPENRPACCGGGNPRRLRGYHLTGERLAGCAQLGQDERVFECALGVIGG
jgi:hypothetical protein